MLLGTLVDENVAADGTSPDNVHWDSWRREDGRWTVVVSPADADQPATFLFDAKSRYVLPADEFAHDLVGDVAIPESGDMAIADALRDQAAAAEPLAEEPADDLVSDDEVVAPEEAAERDHHAAVSSIKEARERRVIELAKQAEDEAAEAAETSPTARPSTSRSRSSTTSPSPTPSPARRSTNAAASPAGTRSCSAAARSDASAASTARA